MQKLYGIIRKLGLAVLLLMLVSIAYAAFMSIYYWHGIGV
tara:strand:+ start:1086 stop:1205 length:120 start_codon:yes stop_codon:yes gene_type:complete